jgi:hypothetical protein
MAIARTSILRGPAIVTFNSQSFYSKSDITLELGVETFDIDASAFGKVDERVIERIARVRFTPAGEWEALTTLWPYGAATIGASVFTGTDRPLVIQTLDGTTITFSAAAVTRMPNLRLSAKETMIGEVEFTCLGKDNEAWTVANNLVATSSAAFADTNFSIPAILTQPYTAAWGISSPWSSFQTFDGFTVNFDLSLSPLATDADGIVDMMFSRLGVSVQCQPLGITEAQLITALGLQGAGNARGRSLSAGSNDLVLTGAVTSTAVITINSAQMKMGGMGFGPTTPRIAPVTFVATREFSVGAPVALFTLANS